MIETIAKVALTIFLPLVVVLSVPVYQKIATTEEQAKGYCIGLTVSGVWFLIAILVLQAF